MTTETIIEATATMTVFALLGFLIAIVLWLKLAPGQPPYNAVVEAERILERYQQAINEIRKERQ